MGMFNAKQNLSNRMVESIFAKKKITFNLKSHGDLSTNCKQLGLNS